MSSQEVSAPPTEAVRSTLKEALWAYLNLAVLWTFAVAQPLFDLLKDNPEFFAARGSSGFDIISFSVLLVVLPPAVLLAVELLAGLAGRSVGRGVHIVFLGALVALIAAQALKKSFDASDTVLIVLSVAIGAALAALWARTEPVRAFLNVLSPAPLVFLALFLFSSQISELAFPDEAKARSIGGVTDAPIVVVLLDELPADAFWLGAPLVLAGLAGALISPMLIAMGERGPGAEPASRPAHRHPRAGHPAERQSHQLPVGRSAVDDHCLGVDLVRTKGRPGEIYNIGAGNERPNIDVVRAILARLGKGDELIEINMIMPEPELRFESKVEGGGTTLTF